MAIKPLRGIVSEWYTPDSEKDEEAPTRFKLKPLTPPQMEGIMEILPSGGIGIPIKNYSQILKMAIEEWENFDAKCVFTNHDKIPQEVRIELGARVIEISQLSEDELGN